MLKLNSLKKIFINLIKKINFAKFAFYFAINLDKSPREIKLDFNTKCLILSPYPSSETIGLGGLILKNPKNFELLCLTNGSDMEENLDKIESINLKKQQFKNVTKTMRIKGSKIFNINSKTLINNYKTFKKIDISETDYIFIPNVYSPNPDSIALLKHFKQFLKDKKDYKKDLKILMYEFDNPLVFTNYFSNIDTTIETKKMLLKFFNPEKNETQTEKMLSLNSFRALNKSNLYCEGFLDISIEDFLNIEFI